MAPTSDTAPRSTVVALVGADSDSLLSGLSDVPALVALSLRETDPAVAARRLTAVSTPYVVHDADPLEHVAAAWVELFEERSTLGTLEVEVDALLALFDAGVAVMPDYYLVAGPELIEGTWRHWWLGALAHRAPSRVLPVEASGAALLPGCAHSPHPGRGRTPPGSGTWPSTSPTVSGCATSPAPPDAILCDPRALVHPCGCDVEGGAPRRRRPRLRPHPRHRHGAERLRRPRGAPGRQRRGDRDRPSGLR